MKASTRPFCFTLQCLRLLPHCPVSHCWSLTSHREFVLEQEEETYFFFFNKKEIIKKKAFNMSHMLSDMWKASR